MRVANALGARVVGIVSSEPKAAVARNAGATDVVRADQPDWPDVVRREIGSVDVAVDPVGGGRFGNTLRLLTPLGRLVVVGFASGDIPQVRTNRLLLHNVSVVGAAWREYTELDPLWGQKAATALNDLVDAGRLRPRVAGVHAWEEAADAFGRLQDPATHGRVVLLAPRERA